MVPRLCIVHKEVVFCQSFPTEELIAQKQSWLTQDVSSEVNIVFSDMDETFCIPDKSHDVKRGNVGSPEAELGIPPRCLFWTRLTCFGIVNHPASKYEGFFATVPLSEIFPLRLFFTVTVVTKEQALELA